MSKPPRRRTTAGVAVAVLAALYTFAAPYIERRTGWDLPSLPVASDSGSEISPTVATSGDSFAERSTPSHSSANKSSPQDSFATRSGTTSSDASERTLQPDAKLERSSAGSTSQRIQDAKSTAAGKSSPSIAKRSSDAATDQTDDSDDLLYGRLRDLGNKRYLSTAGVLYTRGSAEGHRLEHLRRHTADQPTRPGKHGVFDGEMPGAVKTIDLAYEKAQSGQRTSVQKDRDRTVYTVDMGRRVGYIGGREGNRRRKPMARRVRMVMEGNRLITAYPL